MLTVFQGETGGALEFTLNTADNVAVSGYLDVVTPNRIMYRFDGLVASGNLYVSKSGLGQLPAAEGYILLPQVIDLSSRVYFLAPQDLYIVGVPDFFSYAVLTNGNSLLARLLSLEGITTGSNLFTAGASGVQSSKFVAFDGTHVHHADCRTIVDAGAIVGITVESASPYDSVRVQAIGAYTAPLFPFTTTGPVMLGYNGDVLSMVPVDATFVQFLGVVETTQKIQLFIDPLVHIL